MKKTLITLAALAASVASAAVTTNTYTAADFSKDASGNDGTWKVLDLGYTLDSSTDWSIVATMTIGGGSYNTWGSPVFATGGDIFSGSGAQVYLKGTGEEKALLTKFLGVEHLSGVMTGTHAGDVLTMTFSYDKDGGENGTGNLNIVYTLVRDGYTYTDSDSWYNNADTTNIAGISISSLSTSIGGTATTSVPSTPYDSQWAINSVTVSYGSEGSDTVPEPTTATLSLLALAGLAARRRRK